MEKLWKAREKQLEKVLLNAAHIRGSIEGISGNDVDQISHYSYGVYLTYMTHLTNQLTTQANTK